MNKKEVTWTKIGDLEWSSNLGQMNWDNAKKAAKRIGGRLPERWEMTKTVDIHYDELNKLIENDPSYTFWSATEYSSTAAWYVSMIYGYTFTNLKSTVSTQVRCVR
jgi:hypothetical protein